MSEPSEQSTREDRIFAMLCHLGTVLQLGGMNNSAPVSLAFIVPLAIWLIKRDQLPLVRDQGREVVNFCLTIMIAQGVCFFVNDQSWQIGSKLAVLLNYYAVVMAIVGAIRAYDGIQFRYPLTLRLIRDSSTRVPPPRFD